MKDKHTVIQLRVIDKIKALTRTRKDIADKHDVSATTINRIMNKENVSGSLLRVLDKELDLVKIQTSDEPFMVGARVKITDNTSGHEYDIDEIVILMSYDEEYNSWICKGKDDTEWCIKEHEGFVVN